MRFFMMVAVAFLMDSSGVVLSELSISDGWVLVILFLAVALAITQDIFELYDRGTRLF